MKITVGQTSDDRRVLNKSFSGTEINVELKRPCDILNPTFILDYNSKWLISNYVYCPDFHRYYFINNLSVTTGQRIEISCGVDVLMSYRDQIKNLNCLVIRQENTGISLLQDDKMVILPKPTVGAYTTGYKFDVESTGLASNYCFVIGVIG